MADYAMLAEVVKALIVANHFLENRSGEAAGSGLDGLCARETIRVGADA
jgi:hypothetical protein